MKIIPTNEFIGKITLFPESVKRSIRTRLEILTAAKNEDELWATLKDSVTIISDASEKIFSWSFHSSSRIFFSIGHDSEGGYILLLDAITQSTQAETSVIKASNQATSAKKGHIRAKFPAYAKSALLAQRSYVPNILILFLLVVLIKIIVKTNSALPVASPTPTPMASPTPRPSPTPTSSPTPIPTPNPDISRKIIEYNGTIGAINISLSWETTDDLDLLLQKPDGTLIWFNHPSDSNGIKLDVDMNEDGHSLSHQPLEHIVLPSANSLEPGDYKVFVWHFHANESQQTPFTLEISVGRQAQSYGGTAVHGRGPHQVCTLTIGESGQFTFHGAGQDSDEANAEVRRITSRHN